MAKEGKDRCESIFKRRIKGKEPNSLVIMPFNLERKYDGSIEVCLQVLDTKDLKKNTFFVSLNAELIENNHQSKFKIAELEKRDYSVIGEILRMEDKEDLQGKIFANYVEDQLP